MITEAHRKNRAKSEKSSFSTVPPDVPALPPLDSGVISRLLGSVPRHGPGAPHCYSLVQEDSVSGLHAPG